MLFINRFSIKIFEIIKNYLDVDVKYITILNRYFAKTILARFLLRAKSTMRRQKSCQPANLRFDGTG